MATSCDPALPKNAWWSNIIYCLYVYERNQLEAFFWNTPVFQKNTKKLLKVILLHLSVKVLKAELTKLKHKHRDTGSGDLSTEQGIAECPGSNTGSFCATRQSSLSSALQIK